MNARRMMNKLVIVAGGLAALSSVATERAESQEAQASEQEVIRAVAAVAASTKEMPRLWPGFWTAPAFAIYRPGLDVFLFETGTAPAGFVPLVDSTGKPLIAGPVFVFRGVWPRLDGGIMPIDQTVKNVTMAVPYTSKSPDFTAKVIHEAFHGWQVNHFHEFPPSVPQTLPDSAAFPPGYDEALEAERQALLRIARVEDPDTLRPLVREYLRLRGQRLASVSDLTKAIERSQEMLEGTAHFVGLAGSAASRGDVKAVRRMIAEQLSDPARWGSAFRTASDQMAARVYLSGGTMVYLLWHLQCGDWSESIRKGKHIDDAVTACLGGSQGA